MLGSAIVKKLKEMGYKNVWPISRKNGFDLSLANDLIIDQIRNIHPKYIFHSAAKVGGIIGNLTYPADFGMQNSLINNNIIKIAHTIKAKLLFIGSSCIYPKHCPQPIKEEYLLSSELEPTNEMYALSKIFGIKLCDAYRKQYGCDFISCMPCNLYGENDTFDDKNGHVIPALMQRFDKAKDNNDKEVVCWGSGSPRREFLNADDCADACIFLMKNYSDYGHVNIGTGTDMTIKSLCEKIKDVVGFKGNLVWDTSKPDGTPKKVMDVSKITAMEWKPKINFYDGLKGAYKWYLQNVK